MQEIHGPKMNLYLSLTFHSQHYVTEQQRTYQLMLTDNHVNTNPKHLRHTNTLTLFNQPKYLPKTT